MTQSWKLLDSEMLTPFSDPRKARRTAVNRGQRKLMEYLWPYILRLTDEVSAKFEMDDEPIPERLQEAINALETVHKARGSVNTHDDWVACESCGASTKIKGVPEGADANQHVEVVELQGGQHAVVSRHDGTIVRYLEAIV